MGFVPARGTAQPAPARLKPASTASTERAKPGPIYERRGSAHGRLQGRLAGLASAEVRHDSNGRGAARPGGVRWPGASRRVCQAPSGQDPRGSRGWGADPESGEDPMNGGRGHTGCAPVSRADSGRLRNGNPPGDLRKVRRCGAKNRRGLSCRSPAMANGRCRLHGGLSTGPRTAEGIAAIRRARTVHGYYSAVAVADRRRSRVELRMLRAAIDSLRCHDRRPAQG